MKNREKFLAELAEEQRAFGFVSKSNLDALLGEYENFGAEPFASFFESDEFREDLLMSEVKRAFDEKPKYSARTGLTLGNLAAVIAHIKQEGFTPRLAVESTLYNAYSRRKKNLLPRNVELLEALWKNSPKWEEVHGKREKLERYAAFIEEHGYFPSHKGKTKAERELGSLYKNRISNPDAEFVAEIERLHDSVGSSRSNTLVVRAKKLKEFLLNNGHRPSTNSADKEEASLAVFYNNNRDKLPDDKEMNGIKELYDRTPIASVSQGDEIRVLKTFLSNNDYIPGKDGATSTERHLHFYIQENKDNPEVRMLLRRYKSKNVEAQISKIYSVFEGIAVSITENGNTKGFLSSLSEVAAIYSNFIEMDKEFLEGKSVEIKRFCDRLLAEGYESITAEMVNGVMLGLKKSIMENPEANGKYLAWKLNNDLYKDGEGSFYSPENELADLYELKNIFGYLDFDSKKMKREVFGSFDRYLDKIYVKKDGKMVPLLQGDKSVIAEIKGHIITFLEYFNEKDFLDLKIALKDSEPGEFIDAVLNKINNSSLVIPNRGSFKDGKYKSPSSVFQQRADGTWHYSMMNAGRLDLHASYNGRVITASTTTSDENGFEGSQLLLHPMKAKLVADNMADIVSQELNLGDGNVFEKDSEGYLLFPQQSVFYGLKVKTSPVLLVRMNDLDDLASNALFAEYMNGDDGSQLSRQMDKMDSNLLLNKIILEGGDYKASSFKGKKNSQYERLARYREEIVEIGSLDNKSTLLRYFRQAGIKNEVLSPSDIDAILGNHVFDFQSLTLDSLNTQDNELLTELWLDAEFNNYKRYFASDTDVNELFFRNMRLRNPLIKISPEVMFENARAEKFAQFLLEKLSDGSLVVEKRYESEDDENKAEALLFGEYAKEDGLTEGISGLSETFFSKIKVSKNQGIFFNALRKRVEKLEKEDPKRAVELQDNPQFLSNVGNLFEAVVGGDARTALFSVNLFRNYRESEGMYERTVMKITSLRKSVGRDVYERLLDELDELTESGGIGLDRGKEFLERIASLESANGKNESGPKTRK